MAARGHGAGLRWAVVAALVAVLAALPAVIGALPAADSQVSAAALRSVVLASTRVTFSGYAESAGGLALPVTDQLTSVADLFSDRTTMRVWWRGPHDNRVDVVTTGGETDVHRQGALTWTWDYESATVTRAEPGPLALPSPPDLLPSSLGRRLLSEATDGELTRIGARRVAGRDALGLRIRPSAEASSVERVDVWADRVTGLPLQVVVEAKGGGPSALDSRFLDLELGTPPVSVTAFTPPLGTALRSSPESTILREATARLRGAPLPDELTGLPRRDLAGVPGSIGLYGRGITLLAVAPLPYRLAAALHDTMRSTPAAVTDALGIRVAAGPLGLMLVDPPHGEPYVLTGTVTLDALATAARRLADEGGRR